jgi:predicted DNA-binding transcriptional regulator AlpA
MADDQEILTVKELCDLLRLHPATVYKLIRRTRFGGSESATNGD